MVLALRLIRDSEIYLFFQGLLIITWLTLPVSAGTIAGRMVWGIAYIVVLSLSALGRLTLSFPTLINPRLGVLRVLWVRRTVGRTAR